MENIKERIEQIYESAKNRPNWDLQRDYDLSSPGGDIAYFKQRLLELKKEFSKDTMFGELWLANYQDNRDIFETGKVQMLFEIMVKTMAENEVWEQLQRFTKSYLKYIGYQDYIKEEEAVKKEEEAVKNKKKPAGKYYAWYHKILIKLGKADKFADDISKVDIINFGKNKYGTGETFYREFIKPDDIADIVNSYKNVRSMNYKDRINFKKNIIDISNNDADVIYFLKSISK